MSQGSSRPPLLPPIPFRIYLPPRKNQVPGAALHFASCFVVLRKLFLCFFFLMLPDHQLSSSKRATRSPHDDKPNRAPPDPRTLPRPAAGTRLWREAIRYFRTRPKKSNRYNHFFWKPCRGRTAACTSASAFSRTLVRRDDRERTRRARARATSVRFRGSTKGKSEGACRPLL